MQSFVTHHPGLYAACFAGYFVILWASVGWIISHVGGWSALAHQYRTDIPFPAHTKKLQNGQMRSFVGYGRALTAGSDSKGIYLSVLFLFRVGHPPLFIPWTDIVVEQPMVQIFFQMQTLRLGTNLIPLKLREPVAAFLLAAKA